MATVRHAKVSAIADDAAAVAAGQVVPSDWNDDHDVTLVDADIPASIARDTEVTAAVAAHESDTTSVHGITDTSTLYRSGGTDVAVVDGGTGASTAAAARTNLDVQRSAWIDVRDYGAVGDGTTDDGAAFSAAYVAASAAASVAETQVVLFAPPLDYRIETPIIIQPGVHLDARGAHFIGPITGFPRITAPTPAADVDDVDAQTGGACFTDDGDPTLPIINLTFEGCQFTDFRFGFVSKCLAWSKVLWDDIFFVNCNAGIFAYQGAINHKLVGTRSGGGAPGVTYIGAATAYPATHPYADAVADNFFCDGLWYEGNTFDGTSVNDDFDDWFRDSILRPTAESLTLNGDLTFDFTGTALLATGRNIYVPSRNKRGIFEPIIHKLVSYGGPRGAILIANPIRCDFWEIGGEAMFADGPEPMVTILLSGSGATGSFAHVDAVNTTNPSSAAVAVIEEPGSSLVPGTFSDHGDLLGGVIGYEEHFNAFDIAPIDLWIGPVDPRIGTPNSVGVFAPGFAWTTPFQVFRPVEVSQAKFYVAVEAGNIDIGIFSAAGVRLASTGSTACPAAGERTIAFTAPVTLLPGTLYYSAIGFSSGTTSIGRSVTVLSTVGGYINIGSEVLPASGLAVPGTPDLSVPLIVYS